MGNEKSRRDNGRMVERPTADQDETDRKYGVVDFALLVFTAAFFAAMYAWGRG